MLSLKPGSLAVFTASQSKTPACEKEQLGRAVLLPAEALFWRFELGDQAARLRVSKRPGCGLGKDAFENLFSWASFHASLCYLSLLL